MHHKPCSRGWVLRCAALAVLLLAVTAPAWAAPCCQSCQGWPDPPEVLDYCWRHCVICSATPADALQAVIWQVEEPMPGDAASSTEPLLQTDVTTYGIDDEAPSDTTVPPTTP